MTVSVALGVVLAVPASVVANEPPVITNAAVDPADLSSLGGTVTVVADVTDDVGPVEVYVDITGPYDYGSAALTPGGPTPDSWTGVVELPANGTADPVSWTLTVRARDLDLSESTATAGEVTVAGQPPFDEPPLVDSPSVSPTSLPSLGGPVELAFTAWDLRGISEAYAVVTRAGGGSTQVALEPTSADRFTGVFSAPSNRTGVGVGYAVTFHALDDIGQESTIAGAGFTVAPATGRLAVRPERIRFGNVHVGRSVDRFILVKHTGGRWTGAISGVVTTSGTPFSIVGDNTFDLRPGEWTWFRVEFAPATRGTFIGTVDVVRTDGGQPSLGVLVAGRATLRR